MPRRMQLPGHRSRLLKRLMAALLAFSSLWKSLARTTRALLLDEMTERVVSENISTRRIRDAGSIKRAYRLTDEFMKIRYLPIPSSL